MESNNDHCRTFDSKVKGTFFGDGAGVVAFKRLRDALRDGDTIDAVIKGALINVVQVLESVHANLAWRERGVYLITGGLGGIGLAMAEYIANSKQAEPHCKCPG